MKASVRSFILAAAAVSTLTTSCSKSKTGSKAGETTGTLSFTISGDGYGSPKNISFTGKSAVSNFAYYIVNPGYTSCSVGNAVGDGADSIHFQSYFNGNKTTEQHAGDDSPSYIGQVEFLITMIKPNGKTYVYEFTSTSDTPGDIHITKYGDVGDFVEGDFNGTLTDINTQSSVTITNGHFKAPRQNDLPHE